MSIATTIPSHAAWFSLDDVTDLERRALPEYFSPGSELKTSESYKQARNFIVGMYREQPTLYLSLTECRRHLSLDVAAVMRMHQFLEHWGLINYLSQRPHASGAHDSTTVLLDGPASAAVGATAPLARPLALGCGANLSSRANAYRAASGAANGDEKEWTPEATMALLEGLEQFEERCAAHAPPPRADTPLRPRPRPRPTPTSTRIPSIPQPPRMPPRSSFLPTPSSAALSCRRRWEDVAAHVGRTPEECVRQFLRLPLEEPYQPEVGPRRPWPRSRPHPRSRPAPPLAPSPPPNPRRPLALTPSLLRLAASARRCHRPATLPACPPHRRGARRRRRRRRGGRAGRGTQWGGSDRGRNRRRRCCGERPEGGGTGDARGSAAARAAAGGRRGATDAAPLRRRRRHAAAAARGQAADGAPSLPPLTPYHPPTPTTTTTTTHLLTLTLTLTFGQVEELGGILQREREQIERARAQARPFIPPSTHPLSTAATSTTTRPLAPPAPLTPPPTHGLQVFSERLQFERRRLAPPGAPVPTHGVVAASAVPQAQPRTG